MKAGGTYIYRLFKELNSTKALSFISSTSIAKGRIFTTNFGS
jgi:hypothetical protein